MPGKAIRLPPNLARMWKRAYDKFTTVLQGEEYAAWFDTFTPEGRCPAAGDMIRLPDHADTLEEIARTQAESFYRGALAEKIVADSQKHGGFSVPRTLRSISPSGWSPSRWTTGAIPSAKSRRTVRASWH